MPAWLFNLLIAILLVGTPVRGGAVERAERDETAQPEAPAEKSEKRGEKLEGTVVRPHLPRRSQAPQRIATAPHSVPAFRDTASTKFLPPRQFTERRLI
jgi:hypothetical protein